ncbi:MAG: hypothetical protein HOM58_08245 [Rhodospirillaceae bacterium]|jgi:hypothetical protein|nr:hypothetical protein [Rhodospirillaceae bacterium]MBT5456724.1 hypothetical protein [Rhodospirillaceae bacterium]
MTYGFRKLQRQSLRCRLDQNMVLLAQILAALIVAVGILDVLSTNAMLAAGNIEANAMMASLQENLGVWWFIPKLLVHVLAAMFVLWLPSKSMIRKGQAIVLIYALVITNNFYLSTLTV